MAAASALLPCRPHPMIDATLPTLASFPPPRRYAISAIANWKLGQVSSPNTRGNSIDGIPGGGVPGILSSSSASLQLLPHPAANMPMSGSAAVLAVTAAAAGVPSIGGGGGPKIGGATAGHGTLLDPAALRLALAGAAAAAKKQVMSLTHVGGGFGGGFGAFFGGGGTPPMPSAAAAAPPALPEPTPVAASNDASYQPATDASYTAVPGDRAPQWRESSSSRAAARPSSDEASQPETPRRPALSASAPSAAEAAAESTDELPRHSFGSLVMAEVDPEALGLGPLERGAGAADAPSDGGSGVVVEGGAGAADVPPDGGSGSSGVVDAEGGAGIPLVEECRPVSRMSRVPTKAALMRLDDDDDD